MHILILHQNFPGQFRHIAKRLASKGHKIVGIGLSTAPGIEGITLVRYSLARRPTQNLHRYVRTLENGVIHGQAVAQTLLRLHQQGFTPDVVLAHPGWGEALYVKDVFPNTKLVNFFEFFYIADGADVGFDPAIPATLDDRARIRTRNALHLLNLEACDIGISPTYWQKSLHPLAYHSKIQVIHEGIDTELMRPDPHAVFELPNGKLLKPGDSVVTFVARNLEPYRGFHIFMRALPSLLQRVPDMQVAIVGGDDVSYGPPPKDYPNWRDALLEEVDNNIDMSRVHFMGKLPYARYRSLLQVSAAHVYLTYPFVLSWSALEAMSCGCVVIGSRTPPVEEVITHGENGLLVDFFDYSALANTIIRVLSDKESFLPLRQKARQAILNKYTLQHGIQGYEAIISAASGTTQTQST